MQYHKYDPVTLLYTETIEAEEQPENSVSGHLPEETEHYKLAFIDGQWSSVLNPKYQIIDNEIKLVETDAPKEE